MKKLFSRGNFLWKPFSKKIWSIIKVATMKIDMIFECGIRFWSSIVVPSVCRVCSGQLDEPVPYQPEQRVRVRVLWTFPRADVKNGRGCEHLHAVGVQIACDWFVLVSFIQSVDVFEQLERSLVRTKPDLLELLFVHWNLASRAS